MFFNCFPEIELANVGWKNEIEKIKKPRLNRFRNLNLASKKINIVSSRKRMFVQLKIYSFHQFCDLVDAW